MIQVDLSASVRSKFGKGAARTLRREGLTPAILYGAGIESLPLKLQTKTFTKTLLDLRRQNAVFTLNIDGVDEGGLKTVILKDIQVDPVYDTMEHADFYEISLDAPISMSVLVKYSGTAAGVDAGGDMVVSMSSVMMKGLPMDIPDFIDVDVSSLEINDDLTCKDLKYPENVTMLEDDSRICVRVFTASQIEEDEAEETEEGASEDAEAGEAASSE